MKNFTFAEGRAIRVIIKLECKELCKKYFYNLGILTYMAGSFI